MSGKKFDGDKVPLDLIPMDALMEIGKVLAAGAKKYERANWANGIEMSRLISAAMRHLLQFNNGEDMDEECQTLHLANSAVNLMFAIWMYKNRPDMDDRWANTIKKKNKEKEFVKRTNELMKKGLNTIKASAESSSQFEDIVGQVNTELIYKNDIQKFLYETNFKELYSRDDVNIEDNSPYAKVARGMAKFNKEKT